jgi:hypothetical protein
MRKELGKIQRFDFGIGGYDDAMFGLSITLVGKGWGVQDFDGTWSRYPDTNCKWNAQDQIEKWGSMCRRVADLMKQANVKTCSEMVGIPVEVTFSDDRLSSWRILEEVL